MGCHQFTESSSSSPGRLAPVIVHRDENQIRQRFLYRLGIASSVPCKNTVLTTKAKHEVVRTSKRHRACGDNNSSSNKSNKTCSTSPTGSYQELLHEDDYSHDDNTPTTTTTTTTTTANHSNARTYQVRFAPMVTVREIPSFRDYDLETRQQMWMGTADIHEQAQRNQMEYLADGCDYRTATEESGMLPWKGALVHPVTYWMLYEEDQRQQQVRLGWEDLLLPDDVPYKSTPSSSSSSPLWTPSMAQKNIMSMKRSTTMSSLVVGPAA